MINKIVVVIITKMKVEEGTYLSVMQSMPGASRNFLQKYFLGN